MLYVIAGGSPAGELYGVFHVLDLVGEQWPLIPDQEAPSAPVRWVEKLFGSC